MFTPNQISYQEQPGFTRTFKADHLSLGLFFPIEAFDGDRPTMKNQVTLAKRAESLGFSALWFRDVPLRDPNFGDVGQIFDLWVYLGFIAAQTEKIALGTASAILPIRNPLHTAKAATSVDQLSGGRLLLGVASGDRPIEFPAFGVNPDNLEVQFREYLRVFREAQKGQFSDISWEDGNLHHADLIPKPTTSEIPFFVTGNSRQSLDWIAENSHGWINYPRQPLLQKLIVEDWKAAVNKHCGDVFKPFTQSLYIDMTENPNTAPFPIHLGFRLGRNDLIELLEHLQSISVNHVILNLKYCKRPAAEVIEEIGEFVLPKFKMN
ncbi:LLM class oxidoreductase [Methylobacillus flagellatus]|uniref:LLM class oxidoreductase n=1 Tax=Methylobacillus flagellatus TaxID=405 RepID=UPI002853F522|nr:LLM class oxidoreductase [Methylobacillus flagellatus]MDR5172853.1 LLM class oxidoreductase [Methylobacillus flagellatus]